jgi:KDO2-lipid IV(A) lauroyltransferase
MSVPVAAAAPSPLIGRVFYHCIPVRRGVILANLRRVFGDRLTDAEIRRLAQAHYAHLARSVWEIVADAWQTPATRAARVRVENEEAGLRAHRLGRGVLLLIAHLGNWEVAATSTLARFPQGRGRVHCVRRPLPRWLDGIVTRRFDAAGLGVVPKKDGLDRILAVLAAGDAVAFPLDQYAVGRDGVEVAFFGTPTGTFRSLAIVARATGAAVVPAATWRGADGSHVVRFDEALAPIDADDPDEWIRLNTRAYNAALERMILEHPEQWFWAHRRWKGRARD